jgi:hypothetical protein
MEQRNLISIENIIDHTTEMLKGTEKDSQFYETFKPKYC